MDLEVSMAGQDIVYRVIDDPEEGPFKDERCEWASKLETRAREVFGRDSNRVVFRYYDQGIRLSVDHASKASVMQAIRSRASL